MKIEYVQYGLANRFDDHIEINENLKLYPELHDAILAHEQAHTDKRGFNKEDFLLDLSPTNVNYWKLFKFMCSYPKTFLQFAPIYKKGHNIIYDINLLIAWITIISIVGISIFIGLRL